MWNMVADLVDTIDTAKEERESSNMPGAPTYTYHVLCSQNLSEAQRLEDIPSPSKYDGDSGVILTHSHYDILKCILEVSAQVPPEYTHFTPFAYTTARDLWKHIEPQNDEEVLGILQPWTSLMKSRVTYYLDPMTLELTPVARKVISIPRKRKG